MQRDAKERKEDKMDKEVFEFIIEKECKHSRRYKRSDENCPIATIYVERSFADGRDTLFLTIMKGQ